jgi:hypothetical protein
MSQKAINALLKRRYHGAANIRGIRFQLWYTLLKAFDLFAENGPEALRFEGLEDLDLLGFQSSNLYVQVKFSSTSLNWSKLEEPIRMFLHGLRVNHDALFHLAFNFTLKTDIARLASFSSLTPQDKKRVSSKFYKLCRKVGANQKEAEVLLERLSLSTINDKDLWCKLQRRATEVFDFSGDVTDTYILVVLGNFLEWADKRLTIKRIDMEKIRERIVEGLVRQQEFEAYGRHLVSRISWDHDSRPNDFFDGKSTRPGHVAMDLDFRREKWLKRIDQALFGTGVCVVRSSSGQGKSALVYRYALENWPEEHSFTLNMCSSREDSEKIVDYFRHRVNIGLPSFLIIEDAGWQVPQWPYVMRECSGLGVLVLVGVRSEDWFRFGQSSVAGFEVVEPFLDLDEAKEIHNNLSKENRIHQNVVSAESAFEMVSTPALLMEYAYLLTHGCMLEERLEEQVRSFAKQNEDPVKIELLRRITAAHLVGAPIVVKLLVESLHFIEDPQQVLQSMTDEYISVSQGLVTGLHWVRSKHLFTLLHKGYPSKTDTITQLADIVSETEISTYTGNAILVDGIEISTFLTGLAECFAGRHIEIITAVLKGIFRGGESLFFIKNRKIFDKARNDLGPAGSFFVTSELMPAVQVNISDSIKGLGKNGDYIHETLKSVLTETDRCPRGADYVKIFISKAAPKIHSETLEYPSGNLGRLLDWCAFSEGHLSRWEKVRVKQISNDNVFSLTINDFCWWVLGLYRYDESSYQEWLEQNRANIIGYLMLELELISLKFDGNDVSIEFIVSNEKEVNDQAVGRLRKIKDVFPFCENYCSSGIWLNPYGLKTSIDETQKKIPSKNLPHDCDIEKNVVFREAVEDAYRPESYYSFQKSWFDTRKSASEFLVIISQCFQNILERRTVLQKTSGKIALLGSETSELLRWIPDTPRQASENVKNSFKTNGAGGWATSLGNFIRQIFEYVSNQEKPVGRLALQNLHDAQKRLYAMQKAFNILYLESTAYFETEQLTQNEMQSYERLVDLVDCYVNFRPSVHERNIFSFICDHRASKQRKILAKLEGVQTKLIKFGHRIELPSAIYSSPSLTYIGFIVHVDDPRSALKTVADAASVFTSVQDIVDFFCFIPVFDDARWIEEGYLFSAETISKLAEGTLDKWEMIIPREVPKGVLSTLPDYPVRENQDFRFFQKNHQLLSTLGNLPELWKHIEPFRDSKCPFRKKLYKKLRLQAKELCSECQKLAEDLLRHLNKPPTDQKACEEQKHLKDFFEEIIAVANVEGLLEFVIANGITNEALKEGMALME